jgi:hypothetical protein
MSQPHHFEGVDPEDDGRRHGTRWSHSPTCWDSLIWEIAQNMSLTSPDCLLESRSQEFCSFLYSTLSKIPSWEQRLFGMNVPFSMLSFGTCPPHSVAESDSDELNPEGKRMRTFCIAVNEVVEKKNETIMAYIKCAVVRFDKLDSHDFGFAHDKPEWKLEDEFRPLFVVDELMMRDQQVQRMLSNLPSEQNVYNSLLFFDN